jgi:hypothetical protein
MASIEQTVVVVQFLRMTHVVVTLSCEEESGTPALLLPLAIRST